MDRGALDARWGDVLLQIRREARSGELDVRSGERELRLAFADGRIASATSPFAADSALEIAVQTHAISVAQSAAIVKHLDADPAGDAIAIIAGLAKLTPHQTIALRRGVITLRAARSFSMHDGTWTFTDQPVLSDHTRDVDVRAALYLAAYTYLPEDCLALADGEYRLTSPAEGFDFRESEHAILVALADSASRAQLEVMHRGTDRRRLRAMFYALATCGVIEPVRRTLARGTEGILPLATTDVSQLLRARTRSERIPAVVVETALAAAADGED